jgi:uncharacterized membrane protein
MNQKRDQDIGTQRIEALTDGVFAIVMTLLVLELSIPVIAGQAVQTELIPRLIELWPNFYSYVLSFLLLGMLWNGHRVELRLIERSDGLLVLLNTFYLLFLALLPFTTSLIAKYHLAMLPLQIFGLNIALILLARIIMWRYACWRHRLVSKELSSQLIRTNTFIPLLALLITLVNTLIAMISPLATISIYYLLVVFYIAVIIKGSMPALKRSA